LGREIGETPWSLRANPSSGNLHPTEGYVLLPALTAIHDGPGVYHYAPKEHGLERRADIDPSVWIALMAGFPESSFLVGLSSIFLARGLEIWGARLSGRTENARTCKNLAITAAKLIFLV
jgi:nitroreductase